MNFLPVDYNQLLDDFDSAMSKWDIPLHEIPKHNKVKRELHVRSAVDLHVKMERVAYDRDAGLLTDEQKARFNTQAKRLMTEGFGLD
jgi:hypothetical protein